MNKKYLYGKHAHPAESIDATSIPEFGKKETSIFDADAGTLLKEKGIYYICGEIEEGTLLEIHQDILLKHMTPEWKDDIHLFINSPGGSAPEMWALIDLLDLVKMDIWTTGMGWVCSAGAILLAAGTKGKRRATKNAQIMIHQFYAGAEGNYDQLVAAKKDFELEMKRHMDFWTRHTNLHTEEEVRKHLLAPVDANLSLKEALEFGVIDTIVGQEEDKEETKLIVDSSMQTVVESKPDGGTIERKRPRRSSKSR